MGPLVDVWMMLHVFLSIFLFREIAFLHDLLSPVIYLIAHPPPPYLANVTCTIMN